MPNIFFESDMGGRSFQEII